MTLLRTALATALLLAASAGHAQVTIANAWVRATVPQQQATGAFMQISAPKDSRLVAVRSPLTPNAELHEMTMQDNVMRMRQVPGIDVPAGKGAELKPGGFHVMLMGLKQQVKEGETVALTLEFEGKDGQRETVDIKAPVRALNATARSHGQGHGSNPAKGHGEHKH